jgi:hypothetical protein
MEHVNLSRGLEREHVHYHGHDYTPPRLRNAHVDDRRIDAVAEIPRGHGAECANALDHVTVTFGICATQGWCRRSASTATTPSSR